MSADPVRDFALSYFRRVGQPDGHMPVWEWFRDRIPWYDHTRKHQSWTRAKRKDPRRPIAMVGASPGVPTDHNTPTVADIRIVGDFPDRIVSVGDPVRDAATVADALFGTHTRQTSIVVPDGSRWVFDAIIRDFVTPWVHAGYAVQPMVSGFTVKGLMVRKGRYRWTLSDFDAMTATPPDVALAEACDLRLAPTTPDDDLRKLQAWVLRLQTVVHGELGVCLRPTVGGTSVRAAAFDLPADIAITRVQPLLVAMCRMARGFRGGYIYGERYRGPAYKADVRRMYAWALSQPLGWRWALGPCVQDGTERPGIYLCTVTGTPSHPVQLPTWRGESEGFTTALWSGETAIAVLPSSEFAGLRAMGLAVEPGYGFVATSTLTFGAYIDRLQSLMARHGSDGAVGRWCKMAANTLYGRLAVNPAREGVVFSEDRPDGATFPLVTLDGERVENMWHVDQWHHAPSQQVSMAAMVTGYARSKLYTEMARVIASGRSVVHAHTDGLVVTGDAPLDMVTETDTIGAWRMVGFDADTIVARAGGYAVGAESKWSGAPSDGRRTIEVAWSRGEWLVAGRRVTPDRMG